MSGQDPIADFLTRIRNGYRAGKSEVEFGHSGTLESMSKILAKEGYVAGCKVEEGEGKLKKIRVSLRYFEGDPAMVEIARISKPGLRRYVGKDEIPRIKNGLGTLIITTPKGIMTGEEARKAGLGGEMLCSVF